MGGARLSGGWSGRRERVKPLEMLRCLRDPAPPVAGLLFDVGGVLYDDTVWSRWLLKLVARLGLDTHYTPFFRVWQREYLPRVKCGELDYWQGLRQFLRAAGLSHGQIDEVEAAGQARLRASETDIFPLPGVRQVLSCLQDLGVRLSVLSSGYLNELGVRHQLRKLGVDRFFEHVVAEVNVMRAQPGQCSVDVAVALTGLPRSELWYVGHDSAALQQARAAGLRTVAVNYEGDAEADVCLRHVQQLLEALPWRSAPAKAG